MKLRCVLAGVAAAAALSSSAVTLEQSGGIYHAYPYTTDSVAPVPAGFEPVYISHYGRHGSRWMINLKTYDIALEALRRAAADGNLTPAGEVIIPVVEACRGHAEGHSGELSLLGARQHKAIAARMYSRWPSLFADSAVMRSSVEPRCIISMAAFSESLKDSVPSLKISRFASPGDMDFISYSTPEAKAMGREDGRWMTEVYAPLRDSLTRCPASAAKIFRNPAKIENLPLAMRMLHDIAIDFQDVDGLPQGTELLTSIFEPQDLESLWKAANYMMCMRHADATPGQAVGPACAGSLLRDITDRADAFLAGTNPVTADLRFGHDTALIRLLSLAGVKGCSPVGAATPDAAARLWQSYRVSPMAANLQIVFLRDSAGEVLAGLRLNERPAAVGGLSQAYPGYYRWNGLKNYWNNRIENICK